MKRAFDGGPEKFTQYKRFVFQAKRNIQIENLEQTRKMMLSTTCVHIIKMHDTILTVNRNEEKKEEASKEREKE